MLGIPNRSVVFRSLVICLVCCSAHLVLAEWKTETFESPETSWELVQSDAGAYVIVQRRTVDRKRSGTSSEYIRMRTRVGSYAYLAHKVEGAAIIDELRPSLSVYANRAGLQLIGVVVLPRTKDRRTGRPLRTKIRGSSYTRPGSWQELSIQNIPKQLTQQVLRLRDEHPFEIDMRDAYLSHVILNAYTEPGITDIWTDDLKIDGHVTAAYVAPLIGEMSRDQVKPAAFNVNAETSTHTKVKLQGDMLLINDRPFFPRMIEYHGEPFQWLKSRGFNCVKLSQSPSADELQAARRHDMWIVSPPPHFDGREVPAAYDRVLCWSLGNRLAPADLPATRALAKETRQHDKLLRRPLVSAALAPLWNYSSVSDICLLQYEVLHSSLSFRQAADDLRDRKRMMRGGRPAWTYIETEPSLPLLAQVAAENPRLAEDIIVDPAQVRVMVYQAIASGLRGLCFQSSSRLDVNHPSARARAQVLQRVNLELDLIQPWLAASTARESINTADHVVATGLRTSEATLVIATQTREGDQYEVRPTDRSAFKLDMTSAGATDQLYRVSPSGLRTLRHENLQVQVEDPDRVTLIVATQDPAVVKFLSRRLQTHAKPILQLTADLLERQTAQSMQVARALATSPPAPKTESLIQAKSQLSRMQQAIRATDLRAAEKFRDQASTEIRTFRRSAWENAVSPFPSFAASPLCATFDTLPAHLSLSAKLQRLRWSGNLAPEGTFENWNAVVDRGWQFPAADRSARAVVPQLSEQARSGRYSLQFTVPPPPKSSASRVVETPLPLVVLPQYHIPVGSVACIHGWVRTVGPIIGNEHGLRIFDSVGDVKLGEHISDAANWQEFALYRTVTGESPLVTTFTITGHGTVLLDDLSVTVCETRGSGSSEANQ